jgi:hypothetical protein
MEEFKRVLLEMLNEDNIKPLTMDSLQHPTLWNISYDPLNLTFLDIVKGVVPGFLSDIILSVTHNRRKVLDFTSVFFTELFLSLRSSIWVPRCETMILKERQLGITQRKKKKKNVTNIVSNSISFHSLDQDNIFVDNFGLDLEVKIGGNWLGFTLVVNHFSWLVGGIYSSFIFFVRLSSIL